MLRLLTSTRARRACVSVVLLGTGVSGGIALTGTRTAASTTRAGQIWEVTYLKAKPGQTDALAQYIRQNWFVMDAKARAAGHMEGFRLLRGTPKDTTWDLMEISVYADSAQHARIDSLFRAIYRPAHVPVPVDGRSLRDLGSIVGSVTTRWVGGDQ